MSEFENPDLVDPGHALTVDDIREMTGGATPHFALHLRARIARLIGPLDPADPARQLGELEIERLERLAVEGERGSGESDLARLAQAD